ncbi:MAG: TIM barrel protein [Opitutaceae bacterium]|nr:TIM barrel protein [Opitutaceae bacterium]
MTRRDFLLSSAFAVARLTAADQRPPGDVGVNFSSFARQTRATAADQRIDPFELPRLLRDELDVRVIDLVHTTLDTREPRILERFRARAEAAGCVITNLKVNDHHLPFDGDEPAARRRALDEYKRWIDAAALLGTRWLRPYPARQPPRWENFVAGYRELAAYAQPRGITLLVENYLWLEREPDAIPRLVQALAGGVAAAPDTGNWPDEASRRRGLALAFPHAVTADFKVRELTADGGHAWYDLEAAFAIGHRAGFRGPWCIEHTHADRATLVRELREIAARLRGWMRSGTR